MDCGVGYFVVDGEEELRAIDAEATKRGIRQKLLLRLTCLRTDSIQCLLPSVRIRVPSSRWKAVISPVFI